MHGDLPLTPLPTDGVTALTLGGTVVNAPTNFAGATTTLPALPVTAVEYYRQAVDHYFISALQPDIDALDSGRLAGWARTGLLVQGVPDAGGRRRREPIPSVASTSRRSTATRISFPPIPSSNARPSSRRSRPTRITAATTTRRPTRSTSRCRTYHDRRLPDRDHSRVSSLEPARRLEPSLHDRSRDQGADARQGLRRRRATVRIR